MIYRNGKKYMLMKNGQPYQEAYSSTPSVQLKEIYEYFSTHRGETQLAENGNDLIFTFEPFPDDILSYLKYYPHAVELRLACRAGSQYDIWWFKPEQEPPVLKKSVAQYARTSFHFMRLPAVYKWVGKIGYTEILHSPVNGNEGEYPVAVKVDIADLKRGQIVLPGAMDFINTRRRTFYMSPTAKLSLIFQPHDIHTYLYNIVDGEIDPSEKIRESEIECREAPIMESTTIISKHRKNFKEAPWAVMPNTIHRGGTITDEKEITIIRNDLEELGLDNRLSIATDSRDLWFSDETDAANMPVGTVLKRNAVKFLMYSTYDCQVVVRSQSQGWHFEVTKPPIPPTENGTGASTYTSETIGLLENVDDLEIIVLTN